MAIRLEMALGTSAEMWVEMQAQYELWQASLENAPPLNLYFRGGKVVSHSWTEWYVKDCKVEKFKNSLLLLNKNFR